MAVMAVMADNAVDETSETIPVNPAKLQHELSRQGPGAAGAPCVTVSTGKHGSGAG